MSLSTRSLVLRKRILSCSGSTAISAFYRKNTSSILCVGSSTSSFGTIATSTDIMSYRSGDCLGKKLSLEEKGSNLSSMRFTTSHGRGGLLKRGLSSGTMNEGENRESLKELIMSLRSHAENGNLTKIQDTIDQINNLYPEWTNASTALDSKTLSSIFDAYSNAQQTVLDGILEKGDDNDENSTDLDEEGEDKKIFNESVKDIIDSLNHASQITNDVDDLLQEYTALYLDYERNGNGRNPPCQLQTEHFETVISSWHRLLHAFNELTPIIQKGQPDSTKPNVNGAMLSLMRAGRGLPQRTTHHLEMMERLALLRDGHRAVSPRIETYNMVLDMWSKSREHLLSNRAQTIMRKISSIHHNPSQERAATIFSESLGVEPNAETYKIMIRAWCRVSSDGDTTSKKNLGQAAFHAQDYLIRMQMILQKGDESYEPDLDDYLHVFRAWSKAGQEQEAGKRVHALLRKMTSLFRKRLTEVKPDIECYRHALHAISEAAPRNVNEVAAEKILKTIEDEGLVPDSECFTYAIKAWCKSAKAGGQSQKTINSKVEKAHELLNRMAEMYFRSGSVLVRPSSVDYNNVLHAISSSGLTSEASARKADQLLSEMETKFKDGDTRVMPTAESYFNVIRAWNNCPDVKTKLNGALESIGRMKAQYEGGNDACKPTVHCYNAVISVCRYRGFRTASEDLKRKGLRAVAEMVKNMRKSPETQPTSTTYYMLLEAFSVLLQRHSKEYEKTIESIFHQCCREGLVDDRVVRTFNRLAPYESYRRTVLDAASPRLDDSSSDVSVVSNALFLPSEWTRIANPDVPLAIDGTLDNQVQYRAAGKHKMRRLRRKHNQMLLHGGRD